MTRNPVLLVVLLVGLVLLASVLGIIYLAAAGHPIPDVLQNLAIGSLTALVGLLVPARSTTPPGT